MSPNKSQGEDELARQLDALGLGYWREVRFAHPRRWKFDFVIRGQSDLGLHHVCTVAGAPGDLIDMWGIATEIEGGAWNGGHRRGLEANKDCEKSNAAVLLGWRVLRFTPYMVETGEAIECIEAALKAAR